MTTEDPRSLRVLSCVPPQQYTFDAKLAWLDETAATYQPDIFIMPQEYFGGMVIMPDHNAFTEGELLPPMLDLSKQHDMAILVGLVEEDDGKNYQRIWFLDHRAGGLVGKQTKFACPAYTLKEAGGTYAIHPERDLMSRAKAFELRGARVSAMFCWEVFSDFLWFAIGLAEPDLVASMIKFGPMAYPKLQGSKRKGRTIKSFGISTGRNVWLERLAIASKWEANCPIICSTNSWDLPPESEPICGQVPDILDRTTLWKPPRGRLVGRGRPFGEALRSYSRAQIDMVDVAEVRGLRRTKWDYVKRTGSFPPFGMREYTMWTKIHRIERARDGAEQLLEEGAGV